MLSSAKITNFFVCALEDYLLSFLKTNSFDAFVLKESIGFYENTADNFSDWQFYVLFLLRLI